MKRVNHIGTNRVGVGGVELGSRRIIGESATDVAELAELFDNRIDITSELDQGWVEGSSAA